MGVTNSNKVINTDRIPCDGTLRVNSIHYFSARWDNPVSMIGHIFCSGRE